MMSRFYWNSQCLTLEDDRGVYGYLALVRNNAFPAIGGVRIVQSHPQHKWMRLALDLAEAMRKKAHFAQLPLSGGKAVLCLPNGTDKKKYLERFAKTIHQLKGTYITAVDMGSSEADMNTMRQVTPYVSSATDLGGDPSCYTAQTVLKAIGAWCDFKGHKPLSCCRVGVLGVGKVGTHLITQLLGCGFTGSLIIADLKEQAVSRYRNMKHVRVVCPETLFDCPCDVFITAADSYTLDDQILARLQCRLVASAANQPLAVNTQTSHLTQRGIDFLPGYLINVGGLVYCAYQSGCIDHMGTYIDGVYGATQDYLKNSSIHTQ